MYYATVVYCMKGHNSDLSMSRTPSSYMALINSCSSRRDVSYIRIYKHIIIVHKNHKHITLYT